MAAVEHPRDAPIEPRARRGVRSSLRCAASNHHAISNRPPRPLAPRRARLGENGGWSKFSLFESATRVPLWIKGVGGAAAAAAGARRRAPVELVGLYATIAELAGVAPAALQAMPCRVMSCHGISYHVLSCHAMPCHAMPCHAMPCHAMPCRVVSCRVMACRVVSCHVISCHMKRAGLHVSPNDSRETFGRHDMTLLYIT